MMRIRMGLWAVALAFGLTSQTLFAAEAPVTQAEVHSVFTRAAKMLFSVLTLKSQVEVEKPLNPTAPATRLQIVKSLYRLYLSAKPKFKFTPKPVVFNPKRISIKDPAAHQYLEKLITLGLVAPVGPLAAGPTTSLSIDHFGDALGFFLTRIAELTHMPDNKWSPGLTDDR